MARVETLQLFGITAHTAAYGSTRTRPQHSGDTTLGERELIFRLSYLLCYEDESVEGRYARTESATRIAPVSLTRVSPWKF